MTTALKLRPYQRETISALFDAWSDGVRRPAVELPTGMGKTIIFASLIDTWLADPFRRPGAVLVLVHRDELATQTAEKLHMVNPDIDVGVLGFGRAESGGQVIVGGIQTLARENRRRQLPRVGLVIVDECHHASADSYLKVFDHVGALDDVNQGRYCGCAGCWPVKAGALAAGFTATMVRSDRRGLGAVWEKVVYQKKIIWGIENGYLSDARGIALKIDGLDLRSVAVAQGDYADGALGDAYEGCDALVKIAEGYREHGADRAGIVFMPTVATAREYAVEATRVGVPTEVVVGDTSSEDRKLIYKKLRTGDIQAVSNCGVLTEGFDEPRVSLVIPKLTSSEGLYRQMVGRGLRPFPGKTDCLILDPTGVSSKLSLCGAATLDNDTLPNDGESLIEARARQEIEEAQELEEAGRLAEAKAKRRLAGQLTAEHVDLFHSSSSAWLRTRGGVWFIPTRQYTYFLWPDGEHWKVGRCGVYSARGGQWLRGELSFEYAMALAEQGAMEVDATVSRRDAAWRKGQPSQDQRGLAERIGINCEDMRRGALSDEISIHYASRILDRGKR